MCGECEWFIDAQEHTGELVTLDFGVAASALLTGSFDNSAKIWDLDSGKCVRTLVAQGEISAARFSFANERSLTASVDGAVRLWDVGSGRCIHTLK